MDPNHSMMFERQMEADNKSEHTVRSYRKAAEVIEDLDPFAYSDQGRFEHACVRWLRANQDDLSASTIGVRAAGFKYIARALWDADILGSFKAPKVNDFEPHPLPGMMDDVRLVIDAAHNITERRLIALLGYCGLRVSEARVVTSEDFRHEITDDETVVWLRVKGKGRRTREIPVCEEALEVLELDNPLEAKAAWRLVPLPDSTARHIVTELGEKAGLKRRITTHDFRMTFGTHINEQTGSLRTTQELLGHRSSKTTERYTKVRNQRKVNAVKTLGRTA